MDVLIRTAAHYRQRATIDPLYIQPRNTLERVAQQLGAAMPSTSVPIVNSPNFIVIRTSGTTGDPKLLQHPMDFHESVIDNGIESLRRNQLTNEPHTCIIAISRGRLSGGFLFIYEVVRRCGWSILLLGASEDGGELAWLCEQYSVDVIFMAPNNISAVFTKEFADRFPSVRNLLFIGETPSDTLRARLNVQYPQVTLTPFVYSSNDTGPLGIPVSSDSGPIRYEVPGNVLLEIEQADGTIVLSGSGNILASVLGLDDPRLIRWDIGDVGTLETSESGHQLVEVHGRGELSIKFHLDATGGSVILYKSTVMDFFRRYHISDESDLILIVRNLPSGTVVEVNIVAHEAINVERLQQQLNDTFPMLQLRGRFFVRHISAIEAKRLSPGKRKFFAATE